MLGSMINHKNRIAIHQPSRDGIGIGIFHGDGLRLNKFEMVEWDIFFWLETSKIWLKIWL